MGGGRTYRPIILLIDDCDDSEAHELVGHVAQTDEVVFYLERKTTGWGETLPRVRPEERWDVMRSLVITSTRHTVSGLAIALEEKNVRHPTMQTRVCT
jgi:hypothetical protein